MGKVGELAHVERHCVQESEWRRVPGGRVSYVPGVGTHPGWGSGHVSQLREWGLVPEEGGDGSQEKEWGRVPGRRGVGGSQVGTLGSELCRGSVRMEWRAVGHGWGPLEKVSEVPA